MKPLAKPLKIVVPFISTHFIELIGGLSEVELKPHFCGHSFTKYITH